MPGTCQDREVNETGPVPFMLMVASDPAERCLTDYKSEKHDMEQAARAVFHMKFYLIHACKIY